MLTHWNELVAGRGFLCGTVLIEGVGHHAELFRVKTDEQGKQSPDFDHEHLDTYDMLFSATGGKEPLQSIQVPGHEGDWLLFIFPFSR